MEPIASEANLLGAVLARVEDAVGALLPSKDDPPKTISLLYPSAGTHDVSRDLGRLQTSVALTFGGNLVERAGSLDPDTFAIESRRTERERLGLDRRFAAVLSGLSSALASTAERVAPVFVLPVDDVDLNVGECVPLLQLLRTASAPHLVVVLAADVALLTTILQLWYQGQLARISTPVTLTGRDLGTANDLAANALRKHLPPAQRVVLGLVDPERALMLRPLGPETQTLGQVLGRVNLLSDRATPRVHASFGLDLADDARAPRVTSPCWPPANNEDAGEIVARLSPYSWPKLLRQPMRRLVDLYQDSTAYADQTQAGANTGHHVEDSPFIGLARTRAEAKPEETRDDYPTLRVSALTTAPASAGSGNVPAVRQLPWHGWRVSAGYVAVGRAEGAGLIGAVEVLGDPSDEISYRLSEPTDVPVIRQTRWPSTNTGPDTVIDWPWVTHSTVWGYERALAWLAEADSAWRQQPDPLFGSWVAVMTAQLFDAPNGDQPFDRPTRPFDKDWEALGRRLAKLEPSGQGTLADAWLNAVGLLCTPEMGMTHVMDIPALLTPAWTERVRPLRNRRNRNLPPALRKLAQSWPAASAPARTAREPTSGGSGEESGSSDADDIATPDPPARARNKPRSTGASKSTPPRRGTP